MSKRKDSFYTSDDSNDSNDELSLTKNKTKKKKINNESFEIDTKPRDRRRSTKESLFEKQMRLAMEQSLKETNQINDNSVASNDKLPNPEFGLVEKSPKAMHLSDVDETDIPVLCLYDKKDEKLCISKTEFDFLPKSSESNTLKSAEKKKHEIKKNRNC